MRRPTATYGLPRIEDHDRASVTGDGLTDEEMLRLRTDNPVLHTIITEGLESIAPHNTTQKEIFRALVGRILSTVAATEYREALFEGHPEMRELPPVA